MRLGVIDDLALVWSGGKLPNTKTATAAPFVLCRGKTAAAFVITIAADGNNRSFI